MKNSAVDYLSGSLKVKFILLLFGHTDNSKQESRSKQSANEARYFKKKTVITAGKYIYIQFNHADLRREKQRYMYLHIYR